MAIPPSNVYYDSAGVLREGDPSDGIDATTTRQFEQYGGGYVDYSDLDTTRGIVTPLVAGVATPIQRDLQASAANNRINRPFAGFEFWDNTAKLLRGRALYDIMQLSIFIRVIPDRLDGTLRVSINTPTVEIGGKNMSLTTTVGTEESIRADFIFPVRQSFLSNGAEIRLLANVPMSVVEFSPEVYPMGYEL